MYGPMITEQLDPREATSVETAVAVTLSCGGNQVADNTTIPVFCTPGAARPIRTEPAYTKFILH